MDPETFGQLYFSLPQSIVEFLNDESDDVVKTVLVLPHVSSLLVIFRPLKVSVNDECSWIHSRSLLSGPEKRMKTSLTISFLQRTRWRRILGKGRRKRCYMR